MTEFSLGDGPEAFVSTTATSVAVSRAVKAGKLRKLASRLYTRNLTDAPEVIVRRNLWQIVGGYFPGGLVADRTALENAPAEDGSICLVTDRGGDVMLPGLILRPRRGIPPLESDRPFVGGLHLSSIARAYLENMRSSRARRGLCARTLARREIEERLDTLLRRGGEEALNRLRDDSKIIAPALELAEGSRELDTLIGALLGTREANLSAPAARARRAGRPYDPARIEHFHSLHRALRDYPPVNRPAEARLPPAQATLTFFEAYFSNFIEGTEFGVAEAADIVFRGVIPRERPQDAHDVLGTWRIVGDHSGMRLTPGSYGDLVRLLQARHAGIMEQRPEKGPGRFKTSGNRAGSTTFVAPDLLEGTLEQGFDILRSLEMPFQRAVFMMFLISEVHPFIDGNGRTARIMMNAELVAGGEERVVIPTVYRANYLSALKALSRTGAPEPLIRTLDFAQKWTAAIGWGEFEQSRRELEACNAFLDPLEAEERGLRLPLVGKLAP
ncbi:Fic family protein [Skermanella pratensis]|uniref:Fic family protein n=1 Tax=Skermanella pratensis TaxID=2233999 RepID=UPI001300F293|nr:Fic family protein [Skermanella pratensis]